MKPSALFITYDGLLDPLGGSQILPYLEDIAGFCNVHVLSFEKSNPRPEAARTLRARLTEHRIEWHPQPFTTRFGKLGKVRDLLRMYCAALLLQARFRFDVIHCRSYQAMQAGRLLKRLARARVLFDMRGLWVDERVDGGMWRLERGLDRRMFHLYKRIERRLLSRADHIIVLTERVVPELRRISPAMHAPVSVIPCCADFDHFTVLPTDQRHGIRAALGLPANAFVLCYLGSLGTWYLLEEMLQFFAEAARRRDDAHFLVITRGWSEAREKLIGRLGMAPLRTRIHVRAARREEVPRFAGCADVMLSFIKPAYSKIASSPTKLAEAWAMGVPVISNPGVGDVEALTRQLAGGVIVDPSDASAVAAVIADLDRIRNMGGLPLRNRSRAVLGLEVAASRYRKVYRSLGALA